MSTRSVPRRLSLTVEGWAKGGARWRWLLGAGGLIVVVAVVATLALVPSSTVRRAPVPGMDALPVSGQWVATALVASTNALLDDPHHPTWLYAGTESGLWRSTDGGATWRRDGLGAGDDVFALAASRGSGLIVAGASDGRVYARPDSGAVGGWRPISPVLEANAIFSVALSADGATLIAGSVGAIYRGRRDGATWRWRRVARTGDASVTAIAWAPWDARLVFASAFGVSPPVVASRDGGQTWQAAASGLPATLPTEALYAGGSGTHPVILTTMGEGVWQRSTGGAWREISDGLPQRHAMPLVAAPGAPDAPDAPGSLGTPPTLYAGTMEQGVYEKSGTAPWSRLGSGLDTANDIILSLAATPAPHVGLLAGTARGVFRYIPS